MFKWNKIGNVFDPTKFKGFNHMEFFAQGPHVLKFDNFIRVYFSCRPKPDKNGQFVSYSSYVDMSNDGKFNILNISKSPVLDLGETGTFDEFGVYPFSVLKENNKYYGFYGGWTRCESTPFNVAIGLATSTDGKKFERVGKGPVLSYTLKEPFVLSGPKIRKFNNTYYLFYIAGTKWLKYNNKVEPIYKIKVATSKDLIKWDRTFENIIEDVYGENEAQASPDVFYKNGKYHMFFCYRMATDYRVNKDRSYKIGYAYSTDLKNWTRIDEKVGLTISKSGWDSQMVAYPHIFELNEQIYMFYLGNLVGKYGFGVAKLIGDLK